MKVTTRFGLIFLGIAVALAGGIWMGTTFSVWTAWLAAINLVTLIAYGYDKSIAGSKRMRVPETVLLALGAVGGTLGALLGMFVFRHKTIKTSYQVKFWVISGLQLVLAVGYGVFLK
jgi:uncharacterized membrane protein YsdA (DUF1294 family)